MATEVVGEITALKPTARPRPRLIVPLPRSNGFVPVDPLGDAVEHLLDRGVLQDGAGRVRPAVAQQVLPRNSSGSRSSARAIMSVWLS